jgi:glycosyltransferase involved in cell wall biosynthesis
MSNTRVSVVVPTRDNLDLLPKALKSILSQNISEIEIIIADDGSSDGTDAWLDAQMKLEPRLKIINTGGNGPANARNMAISEAKSPLIAFLDADDWWHTGKLKWQVAYLEKHPEIGFSFTDYMHVDEQGKLLGTCFDYWRPSYGGRPPQGYDELINPEAELLSCNTAGTSTIVARKDLLQNANGFATDLQSAEDWDLWLRLAHVAPVACTSIIGTSYLMRPNSESARREDRLAAMVSIIDRYRLHTDPIFRTAVRRADARIYAARADILRLKGHYWSAVAAELHAFMNAPNVHDARAAAADAAHGMRQLMNIIRDKPPIGDKKAA